MSNLLERKNVLKVKKFLYNFNKEIELIVLDETARTAKDAGISLKKEVGAIVKSLLLKIQSLVNFIYASYPGTNICH